MIYLGWLLFAIVVGVGASSRGRSGLGWFALSVLISPLLSLILLLLLPNNASEDGSSTLARVRCPDCAELILLEAKVCKHCGLRVMPAVSLPTESAEPGKRRTAYEIGQGVREVLEEIPGLTTFIVIAMLGIILYAAT